MFSVTDRTRQIKRPSRFIRMLDFVQIPYHDGKELARYESIDASLMGRVVDYLTRANVSGDLRGAFHYSLEGAKYADELASRTSGVKATFYINRAKNMMRGIRNNSNASIQHAVHLAAYDLWYRKPRIAMYYGDDIFQTVDKLTAENIRVMVERSVKFLKSCGGVVKFGFTFEPDGYTDTISSGDGDFLTADTLWDMKVLRSNPSTLNALQVLTYWVMGQHSGQEIFKSMRKIGIFNPSMNTAYILDMQKVKPEVIQAVENEIICY